MLEEQRDPAASQQRVDIQRQNDDDVQQRLPGKDTHN